MSRKSLVYLDDVVQRALKDILIPILGYRDTSVDLGEYTDKIEYLRKDVTALQVKDKSKIYIHDDMSQPINIYLPDTRYGDELVQGIEGLDVTVEFRQGGSTLLAATITIPSEYSTSNAGLVPYCKSCNKDAFRILKNAYVKVLTDNSKKPVKVIQLYFPAVNADTVNTYSRGIVTIYSEHRNAEKVDTWNGVTGNEPGVTVITENEVFLGTVPYFEDIENRNNLVRSNTIKEIEGVTSATYTYLDEVDQTSPTTLYHERQDDQTTVSAILTFTDATEIQSRKDVLMDIFGTDWSSVDIQFLDTTEDISNAFDGFTFTNTPRSIRGKNVKTANGLFANSKVNHITNQAELLKHMPNLVHFDRGFENTPLKDEIIEALLLSNNRLLSIHYCFRNTQIKNTYEFWNMTHTYIPERDPGLSSLEHSPQSVTVGLDGIGCYESVTSLPAEVLAKIPEEWKTDVKVYNYKSVDEFLVKRDDLLVQYNNDLSEITIGITGDSLDITGLFKYTPIAKAPKELNIPGATGITEMFYGCNDLEELYPTTIAKLVNATNADRFTANCGKLTTYPQDIFAPLKKIESYQEALAYLVSMTGPTPTIGGKQLWELAGTEGYPQTINGTGCFTNSSFDNIGSVPSAWGGTGA